MQFTTSFVAAVAALAATAFAAPTGVEKRDVRTGTATWYTQDGTAGSCGNYNSNDAMIVAVSQDHHDAANCGKTITISYGGQEQVATIADTCPGCGFYDLDLSTGLFQKFAGLDQGEMEISWWANW